MSRFSFRHFKSKSDLDHHRAILEVGCPECGMPQGYDCAGCEGTYTAHQERIDRSISQARGRPSGRRAKPAQDTGNIVTDTIASYACPEPQCLAAVGTPCDRNGQTAHVTRIRLHPRGQAFLDSILPYVGPAS